MSYRSLKEALDTVGEWYLPDNPERRIAGSLHYTPERTELQLHDILHPQLLTKWNTRKEVLEVEVARQVPEMNLEQRLRAADRQVVGLALPESSSLIEFVAVQACGESQWKPARYLAFVLPAGEPDNLQMIDLGEAEPIERMIATAITGEEESAGERGLGAWPGAQGGAASGGPGSGRGERIAAMLGVEPLMGGKAPEKRIKECRSPRILHLATHGFFLTDQECDPNKDVRGLGAMSWSADNKFAAPGMENPLLRSGLALAGANWKNKGFTPPPEAEDGLLTAEDVSGLDLLATELVVLSACETGLGEIHVGEGVFGLRRAFVLAGAKSLVMSLWKVPDEQTQELMEDFYQRILRGEGRAEALRQAQLEMKRKSSDPFYWGAFICQGEPGPLPSQAHDSTLGCRNNTANINLDG